MFGHVACFGTISERDAIFVAGLTALGFIRTAVMGDKSLVISGKPDFPTPKLNVEAVATVKDISLNIGWADTKNVTQIDVTLSILPTDNKYPSLTHRVPYSPQKLSFSSKDLAVTTPGTKYQITAFFIDEQTRTRGQVTVAESTIPHPPSESLKSGEMLLRNNFLRSPSGRFKLEMQGDGNLVVYDGTEPIWASNTTWPYPGVRVTMQQDGNFVMLADYNKVSWETRTASKGNAGAALTLRDNGNVTIDVNGRRVWTSWSARRTAPVRLKVLCAKSTTVFLINYYRNSQTQQTANTFTWVKPCSSTNA